MSKRLVTGELYYQPEPELGQGWKFYHYRGRGQGSICGPFEKREDAEDARDLLSREAEAAEATTARSFDGSVDETVSLPFGVFAIVDGRPIAFLGSASPISSPEAVDYARAQRELLRQCIERLDRWIELAKEIATRW